MKSRKSGSGDRRGKDHEPCGESGNLLSREGNVCTKSGTIVDCELSAGSADNRHIAQPAYRLLADKVLALPNGHEGEHKHVSILVVDIPDYSSISAKLRPEQGYKVMAHCQGIIRDQISHYGGTMTQVTKGIVKGLFGAPESFEDHAKRACEAALALLASLREYAQEMRRAYGVRFEMRIGIASGVIVTGYVPTGVQLDYRDLGDSPDFMSLVQSAMRPGKIVVAKSTVELANHFFKFRVISENGEQQSEHAPEVYELVRSLEHASLIDAKRAKSLSKFVGRDGEMSALLEAASKARDGSGQVVAVTGDAGVGKSRLVLEFKRSLPEGQQIFLEGYCRGYDGVPAFHPFLDILKSFFHIKTGEKERTVKKKIQQHPLSLLGDNCRGTIAPLQEIFALKPEDEQYVKLSFQEKRSRIFEAVESILVGASQEKLLVMIVEDLHWMDRTSEELLSYLIGKISGTKILLILLYRPEYSGVSRLGAALTPIHLRELTENHARELTEFVLGCEADDYLMAVIQDQSAGNPLFIEEFTMALLDRAVVQEFGGKCILARDASTDLLPKTIRGVISARMDRLEKDIKITLQVASVIGRDIPIRLLKRVLGTSKSLESHLSRLKELEFMHETSASVERQIEFKHALTQETAYSGLLDKTKKSIHQRTGEAIEELYSDSLGDFYEQLAYHYSSSGDVKKEFQYLKLSAIKASQQNSRWEAYSFGKAALRSLKDQPATRQNKREEIEVLSLLNWAMTPLDYAPHVEQLLKRGEELCLELGDREKASVFRLSLCVYYSQIGDIVSLSKYSESIMNDVRTLKGGILTNEQLKITVPLALQQAGLCFATGDFSATVAVSLRILKSMEDAQTALESYDMPFNAYSWIASLTAGFSALLGDFDNAVMCGRKSLDIAREAKNLLSVALAELWYGFVLAVRGLGEDATGYLMKSIEHFEQAGTGDELAFSAGSWFMLGYAKFLLGDLEAARQHMEKAVKMTLDRKIAYYLAFTYATLSTVHLAAGDVTNAQDCVESASEWAQKLCQKHFEGLAKICSGKILAESGLLQAAKAEASILEGIEIVTEFSMRPWRAQGHLYLGELYAGTGRTQLGIKNLKKAERMFEDMGMDYWVSKTRDVLDRFQQS